MIQICDTIELFLPYGMEILHARTVDYCGGNHVHAVRGIKPYYVSVSFPFRKAGIPGTALEINH